MENNQEFISNLTLTLVFLTSWEEKSKFESVRRAWKGYDFDTLDQLQEEGLIAFSYKSKSLFLTDDGERKAKEWIKRLEKVLIS